LGHHTYLFDERAWTYRVPVEEMNRILQSRLEWEHDLLLVVKGEAVTPKTIRCSKGRKILWWPDVPWRYVWFQQLVDSYDEVYMTSKCEGFKFLPMGVPTDVYREVELTEEEQGKYGCDICFTGTGHLFRALFFNAVFKQLPDVDIKVWGNDWPVNFKWHRGGAVYFEEMAKAVSGGKIVLNVRFDENYSPSFREMETLACNRLLITQPGEGIDECFKQDFEYIPHYGVEDAVKKIRFLLENDEVRNAIARQGREECVRKFELIGCVRKLVKL